MAEASPQPGRYFCHCCSAEIAPRLPDYICPRCESGFIEELPEEPREHQSRHRYGTRQPRARFTARRAAGRHEGVPTLEGIIQQLVNGIIAPTTIPNLGVGPWGVLHSNPMDYAWGANGLDAIITQLLNQFENTGPPPADKEKIQALPTIHITEEHVGSGLECPVCKEDYEAGESVRQLPCNHLFHDGCIVPWLEQVSCEEREFQYNGPLLLKLNPFRTSVPKPKRSKTKARCFPIVSHAKRIIPFRTLKNNP
uniref:RING-type E3 ubiquitin transferase n=1 Tax=Podarcis muralis TaxID=64176 RepID=A0A670K5A1_PODMU